MKRIKGIKVTGRVADIIQVRRTVSMTVPLRAEPNDPEGEDAPVLTVTAPATMSATQAREVVAILRRLARTTEDDVEDSEERS
jgi:hypothetical protein